MLTQNDPAVFLCSPESQAAGLITALKHAGFEPKHYPAFSIRWLNPATPTTTPALVVVTSPNAVTGAQKCGITLPLSAQYLAVGKGTESALGKLGIHNVDHPPIAGSEGLLKMTALQQHHDQHAWILTGHGGRGLLESELPKRNISFERIATYERVATNNPENLASVVHNHNIQVSLISSAEALDNLARISDAATSGALGQSHWIVSSKRIAQQLLSHWPEARYTLSEGPDRDSLLAACIAWQEEH